MLVSTVVVDHLGAAVAGAAGVSAVLFTVVDASSSQIFGIGSVAGFVFTVFGLVFRTQQQQIRSQRVDMHRMARRIEHLENELDSRRHGTAFP